MNVPSAVPVANPLGRALTVSRYCRYSSDVLKSGKTVGVSADILREEAEKRNLSLIQCCAYTDGTKLAIEMACLGNSAGLVPFVRGMEGPRAEDVREAMSKFDFAAYGSQGRLDYLLGAEPGGGVYVIGHSDELVQAEYMRYYKMGDGPYYLFYRPYHLCHVETPSAIASVVLRSEAIMTPDHGRLSDAYAAETLTPDLVGLLMAGESLPGEAA